MSDDKQISLVEKGNAALHDKIVEALREGEWEKASKLIKELQKRVLAQHPEPPLGTAPLTIMAVVFGSDGMLRVSPISTQISSMVAAMYGGWRIQPEPVESLEEIIDRAMEAPNREKTTDHVKPIYLESLYIAKQLKKEQDAKSAGTKKRGNASQKTSRSKQTSRKLDGDGDTGKDKVAE